MRKDMDKANEDTVNRSQMLSKLVLARSASRQGRTDSMSKA